MVNEDEVDPYVSVECLSASGKSATKSGVEASTVVNFNEHIFLELKKMDNEVMQEGVLKLTVLNKGYWKGDVIGEISIALSKVYNKENHVMKH